MLEVDPSFVVVSQIHPNFRCVADEVKTIAESLFHIQLFLPRVLKEQAFLIDALVDEMLLSHKFIIGVLAVAMKIANGLTFVFEFLNILANAGIGFIKFLVAFLPSVEHDGFEQLFVLGVRFDGFQELNELLLEYSLLNGFGVRALLASVVVIRMAFTSPTTSKASGEWLITVLANNEPPQRKSRIVECPRLAFEMKSAFHILALSEQRLINNGFKITLRHLPECLDSTTIDGVCDDFLERLL